MVRKIMRDPLFLAQKSVDATEADKQVVADLLDTLRANSEECIAEFDRVLPDYKGISQIKKIDSILWSIR